MTTETKAGRTMKSLPALFEQKWSASQIDTAIAAFLNFIRNMCEKRYPSREEHDKVPKEERATLGQQAFDAIVATIDTSKLSLFQKFIFWMGDWWYYHPELRAKVYMDLNKLWEHTHKQLAEFIVPALPENIRATVASMETYSVASANGHFAILFGDDDEAVRRIVTDTELFELRMVRGYTYLDITSDGKPIHRCVTKYGGGRAFFDGVRLMAHDRFQTCAPKVAFFKGGYKVNSTGVTIVNGVMLPLIEAKDDVSHSTGAFMGITEFSLDQALESFRQTDATAKRLSLRNGDILFEGKPQKPFGRFAPSITRELDNGFTLVEYAEFQENTACAYNHIMVVDDKAAWIEKVVMTFPDVGRIDQVETTSAKRALRAIVTKKPEAVVLDVHLNENETFEGLWIAREARKAGYKGRILIASSYNDEALQAMSVLTGGLEAPGKNLDRIRKLLSKRQ